MKVPCVYTPMGFISWLLSEALDPNHPHLRANRMEVLDSASAGGYEMYLMKTDHPGFPADMKFQLAVQRSDLDLMNPDHQMSAAPVRDLLGGMSAIGSFRGILKGWIEKWGPISISSLNDRKTGKWAMGLGWMGFTVRRRFFELPGGMGEKEYFVVSA